MTIDPKKVSTAELFGYLTTAVAPRPVCFASTIDKEGNVISGYKSSVGPTSKELTADQRLLLFGDTSKSLPSERMKALWDSDPGNPAYFADYTIRFIRDHERIPPDFLATAAICSS